MSAIFNLSSPHLQSNISFTNQDNTISQFPKNPFIHTQLDFKNNRLTSNPLSNEFCSKINSYYNITWTYLSNLTDIAKTSSEFKLIRDLFIDNIQAWPLLTYNGTCNIDAEFIPALCQRFGGKIENNIKNILTNNSWSEEDIDLICKSCFGYLLPGNGVKKLRILAMFEEHYVEQSEQELDLEVTGNEPWLIRCCMMDEVGVKCSLENILEFDPEDRVLMIGDEKYMSAQCMLKMMGDTENDEMQEDGANGVSGTSGNVANDMSGIMGAISGMVRNGMDNDEDTDLNGIMDGVKNMLSMDGNNIESDDEFENTVEDDDDFELSLQDSRTMELLDARQEMILNEY